MSDKQAGGDNEFDQANYFPERVLGELFVDVQMAKVFKDSKTFVDCIPVENPETILALYKISKIKPGFDLKVFVLQYFKQPPLINSLIENDVKQDMISHLKRHWPRLVVESKSIEKFNSLISLPYPFIVPGGRFREMFYWDSYFTIIGLLHSDEDDLALGMIRNFQYLVNTFSHIPNGNRTYFLSRSQPPFFAEMLRSYAAKHGIDSVIDFLPALEKEYVYWTQDDQLVSSENTVAGRSVWLDGAVLNRYSGTLDMPRPEAYNKEFNWAQALPEKERP